MPEGYTHAVLAQKAAEQAGWTVFDKAAFIAGANGPDVLFSFESWMSRAKRRYPLKELGNRMHTDNTGAFLQALCKHAKTQSQLDYFMGFLAHYAADTTVHPYVCAVTKKGEVYGKKNGHGYFESALDTYLCEKETGRKDFTIDEFAPKLLGAPLAEVVAQLDHALQDTYGLDIPREYLTDAFFHNRAIRSIFSSRFGIKRALFWLVEPFFGGRGILTVHVHPRPLRGVSEKDANRGIELPLPWKDPVTREVHPEQVDDVLARAVDRTAEIYSALLTPDGTVDFWALVGSNDYVTGTPTKHSIGEAPLTAATK